MSDARIGDLDRKDLASRAAGAWAERTQAARAGRDGAVDPRLRAHFAQIQRVGGVAIATTSDGVGTKVELAERTGVYRTLGFDLVAMVADDLAAAGVVPLSLTNVLDVDRIDPVLVDELMGGLAAACMAADMCVTGGEIAELGPRVGGYGTGMHLNWCATAIGTLPAGQQPLSGALLTEGDVLVGLPSPGLRSNGLTLARGVLEAQYGPDWHTVPSGGSTWGLRLLTPSVIYAPHLTALRLALGDALTGCAHITGGGVPNKLGRVLRATGLGAALRAPLPPSAEIAELAALGGVAPVDAWRVWNQGHGMILCLRPDAVDAALALLAARGCPAAVIGAVVAQPGVQIWHQGPDLPPLHYRGSP